MVRCFLYWHMLRSICSPTSESNRSMLWQSVSAGAVLRWVVSRPRTTMNRPMLKRIVPTKLKSGYGADKVRLYDHYEQSVTS